MKTNLLWRLLSTYAFTHVVFLLLAAGNSFAYSCTGGVCTFSPSDASQVPTVVANQSTGTKFVFTKGTYRLPAPIIPRNGDTFVGQDSCSPPTTSCDAILEGSTSVGSLAVKDPTTGYYKVTGQTQSNPQGLATDCLSGWTGCRFPEDLYFNSTPYQHIDCTTTACNNGTPPTLNTHQWWFDYNNNVIWFFDNPSGQLVETSVIANAFGGPWNNVTIQYLTIKEFADMYPTGAISVSQGANALTQGTNWTIENSEVTLNHGFGIRVAYREQILNDYIHENGQLGIGGGISAVASGTVDTSDTTVTWESGSLFSSSWTGTMYLDIDNTYTGYTLSSCSSDGKSCTLTTSPGTQTNIPYTFVLIPQSTNAGILVQGNTIENNNGTQSTGAIYAGFDPGFGAGGIKVGSTTGMTISGNTISGNLGSAIHFDVQSGSNTVKGNTITNNTDGSAVAQEISFGPSTWRNNIVRGNGDPANTSGPYYAMQSQASTEVDAYCNVIEIPDILHVHGWIVGAADRGYSAFPPFGYLDSTGNDFRFNTVIWDAGATGNVGLIQNDNAHQPNFLANNSVPNYNSYHASSTTQSTFVYSDADDAPATTFANYQNDGADKQGTIDTNYDVGFPSVTITSPADGSTFHQSVTVESTDTDNSGIQQVQFYLDLNKWGSAITSPPYNTTVTTSVSGSHTVAAMALSKAGVSACYAITVIEQ
jgi:parallel beta-helix repeat protein